MCGRLSTESRSRPPLVGTQANRASCCHGNLCSAQGHLANIHCKNVMFGLIRKIITCLVRIKYFRGP